MVCSIGVRVVDGKVCHVLWDNCRTIMRQLRDIEEEWLRRNEIKRGRQDIHLMRCKSPALGGYLDWRLIQGYLLQREHTDKTGRKLTYAWVHEARGDVNKESEPGEP